MAKALQDAINKLNACIEELADKEKKAQIDYVVQLQKAAEESYKLIAILQTIAEANNAVEIGEFLQAAASNVQQLHNLTSDESKRLQPTTKTLTHITNEFDKFINAHVSKTTLQRMRSAASMIGSIDKMVLCCETLPYYWDHSDRTQKIALALSATMLVTSVAVAIAMCACPPLAAVPFLGVSIAACCTFAKMLYTQAIMGPQKQYEDDKKIQATLENLDNQQVLLKQAVQDAMPTGAKKSIKTAMLNVDAKVQPVEPENVLPAASFSITQGIEQTMDAIKNAPQ